MVQLLSGYHIYMLSILVLFVALTTILHLQFGLAGIANFGISGIFGLGMYACSLLILKFHMPFIPAVILATLLTGMISMALGGLILDLDSQSVLVGTLAFLVIVETLAISEKWLTNGVLGLGSVKIPLDAGNYTKFVYFLIILIFTAGLLYYAWKLKSSPPGRLLQSIQNNEPLSRSLGKPTFRQKLYFFTFTSALAGFFGALSSPVYHYVFPEYMSPAVTFTIWIALMLGSRKKLFGGLFGILITVGLFDIVLESIVQVPPQYAGLFYNTKYFLYGLVLMLVLMFRPSGLIGDKEKGIGLEAANKSEIKEG